MLIEAKAYLSWSNPQLKSKACRLKDIFGIHGRRRDGVELHFVLMTEQTSKNICTDEWPGWMKADAESLWLQYSLPSRYEITRCTDRGKQSSEGDHLRLRCVPRPKRITIRSNRPVGPVARFAPDLSPKPAPVA